jgi:hypothetical protein
VVWDITIPSILGNNLGGMAVGPDASVVVAGWFEFDIDLGQGTIHAKGGTYDLFVAKYSATGEQLFAKTFGSEHVQKALDVAVDSAGNIIVAGEFWEELDLGRGPMTSADKADAFVAKFDCQGNLMWAQQYGGEELQDTIRIVVDAADNIVVAGNFPLDLDFETRTPGSEQNAQFVFKLDGSGKFIWKRSVDGGDIASIVPTPDDEIVIGGTFSDLVDLGEGFTATSFSDVSDVFVARLAR